MRNLILELNIEEIQLSQDITLRFKKGAGQK